MSMSTVFGFCSFGIGPIFSESAIWCCEFWEYVADLSIKIYVLANAIK